MSGFSPARRGPMVLHVGGMKTGSSALQHDFTWQPVRRSLEAGAADYEYVSLLPSQVLRGPALARHAAHFAAHYSMSDQIPALLGQPAEGLATGLAGLEAVSKEGRIPILSYETWLTAPPADVHAFTAAIGSPIRVVAYVRPPVQWLASLYYQQDSIREANVGSFLRKWIPKARWAEALTTWRSAPNVARVDVRLHSGDICADFCRLLGCVPTGRQTQHNRSFPAEAIRLLERCPLPKTVSLSEAKFALWRWLPDSVEAAGLLTSAAFPFSLQDIAVILEETANASHQLLGLCDAEIRQRIENDPRWWSPDASHHLPPSDTPAAPAATGGDSDALAVTLWQCLLAADAAWRKNITP